MSQLQMSQLKSLLTAADRQTGPGPRLLQVPIALAVILVAACWPAPRGDDDRGEIASSVWYMVGLVLLAVTVLAVVGAKVQGKLAGI